MTDEYDRRRKSRSRSRSRSPSRRSTSRRSRSPKRESPSYDMSTNRYEREDSRPSHREVAATEAARRSQKENRVYVGNLSFQVRWGDLKDFMREAGNVVFAEVMTLPNGMSKGCGVVEFSTREEAQRAIRELNDQTLLGRAIFIREDREDEARFGTAAVGGRTAHGEETGGRYGGRGGGRSGAFGAFGGGQRGPPTGGSKQLYVGGLNWEVGWQDLKDLFRQAGDIVRADIHFGPDGNPKGSGSVTFTNAQDAANAITMFDGAELNGMKLEVREERFSAPSSGPFGSGLARPVGARGGGGFGRRALGPADATEVRPSNFNAAPSNQIFVKNVRCKNLGRPEGLKEALQLPWSTSNDDLVELFQTTGQVDYAEVLHENGRSKGVGIVQFPTIEEAQTAIEKFQAYHYGGRALNIEFNARYRDFVAQPPTQLEAAPYGGENGY